MPEPGIGLRTARSHRARAPGKAGKRFSFRKPASSNQSVHDGPARCERRHAPRGRLHVGAADMKRIEDDFPLETATGQYVTRRQFSKFLVLTSLGMFVGNLWILVNSWFQR